MSRKFIFERKLELNIWEKQSHKRIGYKTDFLLVREAYKFRTGVCLIVVQVCFQRQNLGGMVTPFSIGPDLVLLKSVYHAQVLVILWECRARTRCIEFFRQSPKILSFAEWEIYNIER